MSVKCREQPVLQGFHQASAHENLFRRVQYCHMNSCQRPLSFTRPDRCRHPIVLQASERALLKDTAQPGVEPAERTVSVSQAGCLSCCLDRKIKKMRTT
ncbi:hypothetical protein SRHO_G00122350 [Serrasalmus rhombeus]